MKDIWMAGLASSRPFGVGAGNLSAWQRLTRNSEGSLRLACCCLFLTVFAGFAEPLSLETGSHHKVGAQNITIVRRDTMPVVENDYTRLFKFDSVTNPKLRTLREEYHLDAVIAPGKDEFQKQLLLLEWAHNRFKRFGQPTTNAQGALEILHGIAEGHRFFCTQYAQLFASAAASTGWIDRVLALRRHQAAARDGSTEHSTTEIWSNQHRKWIMLDPTLNMYVEKDRVPLNAYEIRQEWFYHNATNLTFVLSQGRYRKSDLPVLLRHYPGFGDLVLAPDELDKYGFIGYIPNTDLMTSGFNYADMFIVKDKLCDGTQWHKRKGPENPAKDPYFPMGLAAMELHSRDGNLYLDLKTFTPNFDTFQVQFENGKWFECKETVEWKIRPGMNSVYARSLNRFGIAGPVSSLEIRVER